MPFHNHSIHTCTSSRSLHTDVAGACAVAHQGWEQTNRLDQVSEQQLLVVGDLLRLGVGNGLASAVGVDSQTRDPVVDRDRTEDIEVGHVAGTEACRLDPGCHHTVSTGWEGKLDSAEKWRDLVVVP